MRRSLRLPFTVAAIAIAALGSAPDDAVATPTLHVPRTNVVGSDVQTLIVHSPAYVRVANPCSVRRRSRSAPDPELGVATIDQNDPWTGAAPRDEIANVYDSRRPLDSLDPWNGAPISPNSATALAPSTLDTWTE